MVRVKVVYISKLIKPPLVVEHVFPLTGFVCKETHITVKSVFDDHLGSSTAIFAITKLKQIMFNKKEVY